MFSIVGAHPCGDETRIFRSNKSIRDDAWLTAPQDHPLPFYSRMMTSSNGTIVRVTGHLTRSFGVFFDLGLNERLSEQS